MPLDDRTRVLHLREAAQAVAYTAERSRQDLEEDELLMLALVKLVEIVGEAAKGVSDEFRLQFPGVAWSAAGRMRDRLVHHYFDVDLDVLWQTIREDLPALLAAVPDPDA
ncbi:MAG: HepT-like ribonuclease domain-containing protein [Sporichthyaceae bacterium]